MSLNNFFFLIQLFKNSEILNIKDLIKYYPVHGKIKIHTIVPPSHSIYPWGNYARILSEIHEFRYTVDGN